MGAPAVIQCNAALARPEPMGPQKGDSCADPDRVPRVATARPPQAALNASAGTALARGSPPAAGLFAARGSA